LIPAFEDRPLSSITPADVRAWYASAMVDKPTMRAHSYSLLRTMMTTAVSVLKFDINAMRNGIQKGSLPTQLVDPDAVRARQDRYKTSG
jgi:hypothetical protein